MKWEEFERGVWTTLIRFGLGAIVGWILAIVLGLLITYLLSFIIS